MELEELSRLEKIVDKLVSQFSELQQENKRLEEHLRKVERETIELRETALRLKEEKNVAHQRIITLIQSLEKWEEGQQPRSFQGTEGAERPAQQDLYYPKSAEGFGTGG
jgi:predicted nuclease with TOPRIM domain